MADEFKQLIKEEGQAILIYLGKEVSADPFEENVNVTLLAPIPIRGLVNDLISSQIKWKMIGIDTSKAKELIIPNSKRNLIEQSQEIGIDDERYLGYRDNSGKFQIRKCGDYIRCYVYIKVGV